MIKIAICVRNRLGVTKKCVEAIRRHSTLKNQIYIFDNLTNYRLNDHFNYFYDLFSKGIISQYVVNSKTSTYGAFSKASALNQFGLMHEMDPHKKDGDMILFLDNDIILSNKWDKVLINAWKDVNRFKLRHIKVIGQLPGGIKYKKKLSNKIAGYNACIGKFGGSGLWSVRSNFFKDVGYLNLNLLLNKNKQHDQLYWKILDKKNMGKEYILGLDFKAGIHVGKMAGSVCNRLTRNKKLDISFEEADKKIEEMSFEDFYSIIYNDKTMINDW